MEKVYADALARAFRNGESETKLVDGLIAHLKREGRMKLLPRILREVRKELARSEKLAPQIEVASEEEKGQALKEATAEGIDPHAITVNDSLIKGWRARKGGTLIDRTGKKALVELYRNIITK